MPGVRLRPVSGNSPDAFELVIEDRREPGDEVHESHGIRFYVPGALASRLGDTTLDVSGEEFVLRARGSQQR